VPAAEGAPGAEETLREFTASFSYGTRSDLTFKFLKHLSAEEAGEAIRQILRAVASSLDSGSTDEVHDLVLRWQQRAYRPAADAARRYVYDESPFTPLERQLAASRVGLLTSSGHFVAGDDPQPLGVAEMTQADAEARIGEFLRETPVMSAVPLGVDAEDLRVRHGGYDVASAVQDHNVAFPRDALLAMRAAGRIGEIADPLYSFPGATSQGRLLKMALPGWVEMLQAADIDVLLLVPV